MWWMNHHLHHWPMNLATVAGIAKGSVMDTGRSPNIDHRRLDDLRRGRGPIQEHVIDEFAAGRLSRRDFIRRGSAIGLSMPLLGGILAACGSGSPSPSQTPKGKAGGTIQAGILVPAPALQPPTLPHQGGLGP